jgi:hypothetical protein
MNLKTLVLKTFLLGVLLLVGPVHASTCVVTPLQTQLEEADIVFVATVTETALVDSIEELSQFDLDRAARGQRARGRSATVRLFYEVREAIKGDPEEVSILTTSIWYDNPMDDTFVNGPSDPVSPGDNLLVIGNKGQASFVGYCRGSKRWTKETREAVKLYLDTQSQLTEPVDRPSEQSSTSAEW